MKILPLLAVLLAAPAAADTRTTVNRHGNAKISAHTLGRFHNPYALSYEGPKGHYLVTAEDLYGLGYDDENTQTRYNVWGFSGAALTHKVDHRAGESKVRFDNAGIVAMAETAIDELVKKGKKPAPAEFADKIKAIETRAARLETRRKALEAAEALVPGTIKDPAALAKLKDDISSAADEAKRIEEVRVEVEPKLDQLIDPNNPNPKASFYAGLGHTLAEENRVLDRVQNNLDWQPK